MLLSLGSVVFDVHPFNAHEIANDHSTDFVDKPVVGARMPMEWVGEGEETWDITGRIFPKKLGGLNDLARLRAVRAAGSPVYLMRGDGRPMGFVVILGVSEISTKLAADGVGQIIEFDLTVKRSGAPSIAGFLSMFG